MFKYGELQRLVLNYAKKTQILWNSLWSSDQTSRRFLKSE